VALPTHPCTVEVQQFDRSSLRHVEIKIKNYTAILNGLNEKISQVRAAVCNLKSFAETRAEKRTRKRFGRWSLKYIYAAIASVEKLETIYTSQNGLRMQILRLLFLDMGLWFKVNDNIKERFRKSYIESDPRAKYLQADARRKKYRVCCMFQALLRGHFVRTMPRVWNKDMNGVLIVRGCKRIGWRYFGEVCVRTKMDVNNGKGWSRTQRFHVALLGGSGHLLFFENEKMEHSDDADCFNPTMLHLRLHFFSNLSTMKIEDKNMVKNDLELPGFSFGPCIVDDSGTELWLPAEQKQEQSRVLVKQAAPGCAWIYAPSDSKVNRLAFKDIHSFVKLIQRESKVRQSKTEHIHRLVKARMNSRRYYNLPRVQKRFRGGDLLTAAEAVKGELQLAQMQLSRNRNKLKCIRQPSEEEKESYSIKIHRVFKNLDESYRRAFGKARLIRQYFDEAFISCRVYAEAAVAWLVRTGSKKYNKLKDEFEVMKQEACRRMVRRYRLHKSKQKIGVRIENEKARRIRYSYSRFRHIDIHNDGIEMRWIFYRLRRSYAAAIIQGLFWRVQRRKQIHDISANIIQRFFRCTMAKIKYRAILKLKQEHDEKIKRSLFRIRTRRERASLERWTEYTRLYKVWCGRYNVLHRRMCAKVLQRAAHNLHLKKMELCEAVLGGRSLHPRVAMHMAAFQSSRDFDKLLLAFNEDYHNRKDFLYAWALTVEESMLQDARAVDQERTLRTTPVRWRIPAEDVNPYFDLVVYRMYRWPCIKIIDDVQYIVYPFWKLICAINLDYWSFTQLKRRAELAEFAKQEQHLISCFIAASKPMYRKLAPIGVENYTENVLLLHDTKDCCNVCYALFTDKCMSRCHRCNTARYIVENKRRSYEKKIEGAEAQFDLLILHAAFVTMVEQQTRYMMTYVWHHDPETYLSRPSFLARAQIDVESIWWEAVVLARPWICRLKDAGIGTIPNLFRATVLERQPLEDWGIPKHLGNRIMEWLLKFTNQKPKTHSALPRCIFTR